MQRLQQRHARVQQGGQLARHERDICGLDPQWLHPPQSLQLQGFNTLAAQLRAGQAGLLRLQAASNRAALRIDPLPSKGG